MLAVVQLRPSSITFLFHHLLHSLEQFRIKNHLKLVEQKLRQTDVSDISVSLQKKRSIHLAVLHQYWNQGQFPTNSDFSDKRMPYFVDTFGVKCAMAEIIYQSDNSKLVQKVATTNNNVFINDLKKGPVINWIKNSGLTQKEAALIQPTYGPCGMSGCEQAVSHATMFWIISSVAFIVFELFTLKITHWLPGVLSLKKLLVFITFIISSFFTSLLITSWSVEMFMLSNEWVAPLFILITTFVVTLILQFIASNFYLSGVKSKKMAAILFFSFISFMLSFVFTFFITNLLGLYTDPFIFLKLLMR